MSSPRVTVIIPVYNAESTLREAVESALAQTWSNTEVLVVDDGSTDASLNVARSFGASVHLLAEPHRGAAASRNTALQKATGEFIQFLDADDIIYHNKLAAQMNLHLQSSCDLVYCDGLAREARTERILRRFEDRESWSDPLLRVLRYELPITAPIYRRSALLSVGGFRENLPCAQERDLHIRLAARGARFLHLSQTLYEARRFPGSLSSSYERVLDQYEHILWPVYHDLRARGELSDQRARAFSVLMARAARHYAKMGDLRKAHAYLDQARQMHPDGGMSAFGLAYRLMLRLLGPTRAERLAAAIGKRRANSRDRFS